MAKCTAITRGGERCKGIAIDSSGYCYSHHPDHATARQRAARKGGRRGGRGRPQNEVAAIKESLWQLADDTRSGEVDKGVAHALNQTYTALLKACSVSLDVEERLELRELATANFREFLFHALR